MLELSCHCGLVRLTSTAPRLHPRLQLHAVPQDRRALGLFHRRRWSAFDGPTRSYRRTDKADPAAEVHFCGECGATTHFTLTAEAVARFGQDLTGVNMWLADESELAGIELRYPDGAAWAGAGEFGYVREARVIGQERSSPTGEGDHAKQGGGAPSATPGLRGHDWPPVPLHHPSGGPPPRTGRNLSPSAAKIRPNSHSRASGSANAWLAPGHRASRGSRRIPRREERLRRAVPLGSRISTGPRTAPARPPCPSPATSAAPPGAARGRSRRRACAARLCPSPAAPAPSGRAAWPRSARGSPPAAARRRRARWSTGWRAPARRSRGPRRASARSPRRNCRSRPRAPGPGARAGMPPAPQLTSPPLSRKPRFAPLLSPTPRRSKRNTG